MDRQIDRQVRDRQVDMIGYIKVKFGKYRKFSFCKLVNYKLYVFKWKFGFI